MPIPKIIHFKVPRHITDSQQAVIDTARKFHPDWQIMIWQDPVQPDGFKLARYWEEARSGAQVADLIRIEVLWKYGGVYLDSDLIVHRPLDELAEACGFFIASEDGQVLTNAAFGSTVGHPALADMIDELDRHPPDWSLPPNVTTGPCFFTRILETRKDITVLPRETFYPYNWNEKPTPPHPFSYGTHLWEGSWIKKWVKLVIGLGLHRYLMALSSPSVLSLECKRWLHSREWALKRLSVRTPAYSMSDKLATKTVHGHSIVLSGQDLSVTPAMAQRGYGKLREELFIKRVLRGGDYFVDVGANVGTFSLLAASLVGPFGRVYAYEPNPLAADLLRSSATMNVMHEQLVVSNMTIGERAGSAVTMPASVATLATEFPYDLPIKFLKIDVGGSEASVLRGAERLLSRQCVDYVMIEAIKQLSGKSWLLLLDALQKVCAYGYRAYYLGRNGHPIPIELAAVLNTGKNTPTSSLVLMNRWAAARHS
jgi:hypothetical protein